MTTTLTATATARGLEAVEEAWLDTLCCTFTAHRSFADLLAAPNAPLLFPPPFSTRQTIADLQELAAAYDAAQGAAGSSLRALRGEDAAWAPGRPAPHRPDEVGGYRGPLDGVEIYVLPGGYRVEAAGSERVLFTITDEEIDAFLRAQPHHSRAGALRTLVHDRRGVEGGGDEGRHGEDGGEAAGLADGAAEAEGGDGGVQGKDDAPRDRGMYHRWADIKRRKLSPAEVAKVEAWADEEARGCTLEALRKRRNVTQADLAEAAGFAQSEVSRIEGRLSHQTETLRRYVEALGGRLRVVAVFGEEEIPLSGV